MKIKSSAWIKISLVILIFYEVSTTFFQLTGLSVAKITLTSLVWGSFSIIFFYFIKNYHKLKHSFPRKTLLILKIIFVWNIISILRSTFFDTAVTTLFGNIYTALALLLPLSIIFAITNLSLLKVHRLLISLLKLGLLYFLIIMVINGGLPAMHLLKIAFILISPIIFLIPNVKFEKRIDKLLITTGAVVLFYVAFKLHSRTMIVREILLILASYALFIYRSFNSKIILRFSFLLLLIPFSILYLSINSGQNYLQKSLSFFTQSELTVDTRTFLYQELFRDLSESDRIVIGKGANGTYFSDYFSNTGDDAENRLTVEVGILAVLLKGGLIGAFFYLLILFFAIYLAFFRSSNHFTAGLGFVLIVHTLILFIENLVGYSSYNFLTWYFIGLCLSKEIRFMTNEDIKNLLYKTKKNEIASTYSPN